MRWLELRAWGPHCVEDDVVCDKEERGLGQWHIAWLETPPSRVRTGSDSPTMKVWVTLLGKQPLDRDTQSGGRQMTDIHYGLGEWALSPGDSLQPCRQGSLWLLL